MKKKEDFIKYPNLVEVILLTKESEKEKLIKSLEKAGFPVYQKPRFIHIQKNRRN